MGSAQPQEAGVDRAFDRLYRRHVADVYRYAYAVLRNASDAGDVTQTTFLNAYRAFQAGERPESAHSWLIAIAHRVCRQRARHGASSRAKGARDDVPAGDDERGPGVRDVQRALASLPFEQRAALVMRELERRSYAEISEIRELSVARIETLIFRARRALRERLEGALTCHQAERAISKDLDRQLTRDGRAALRVHLLHCADCQSFARGQRAQRRALRALAAVSLPSSLASFAPGRRANEKTSA